MHAQDDDGGIRRFAADPLRSFQSVERGLGDVEHGDVGLFGSAISTAC